MKSKQKTLRSVCAVILACLTALTSAAGSASAAGVQEEPVFHTLAEAESTIEALYDHNYTEIAEKIREIKGGILPDVADEALTLYYGSCGGASIAFQKVLIDNNIYVESRMDAQMYGSHEYNFFRTRLSDGTVKLVLIDGAYRQFMRNYFKSRIAQASGRQPYEVTDGEVDEAILATSLPNVLIFDFSNKEEAVQKIKDALGEDVDESAYSWINDRYESQPYPEPALQSIHTRYLTDRDVERLSTGIPYDKPYSTDLYVRGSWDDYAGRQALTYQGNAVYEINLLGLTTSADGIYELRIEGEDGTLIYGSTDPDPVCAISKYTYSHATKQWFLTDDQGAAGNIRINPNGSSMALRLDIRAGLHAPQLRGMYVSESGIYGDIDDSREIDMVDVVMMQKALSGAIPLDVRQLRLCDVNGDGLFTEEDIILVQRYLAQESGTGRTGETAFSPVE